MKAILRTPGRLGLAVAAAWLIAGASRPAAAQIVSGLSTHFELAGRVHVDEVGSEAQNHLSRLRALVADKQWADAIQTLREIMENHGGKVIAVTDRRYVGVRDYCHMLLAGMPEPALTLYREQVDTQARQWYEQAMQTHEAALLRKIVDQLYCSSWGDDALLALGELALEAGDYATARNCWEQLVAPTSKNEADRPAALRYPNSDVEPSDLLARLVLVSILEGSSDRAQRELASYRKRFAEARGLLGGREVNYAEELGELSSKITQWREPRPPADWPTFAGSQDRNHIADATIELGPPAWKLTLPKPQPANASFSQRRIAEDRHAELSYHPIVVGDLLLVSTFDSELNQYDIRVYDVRTGQPAWGDEPHLVPEPASADRSRTNREILGAARFTLTAHGNRLFARMGNPVTSTPPDPPVLAAPGYVVCLDLAAQGRLVWRAEPPGDHWAFEGSPVCDGANVYIAMRRSDVLPQYEIACLDAATGTFRWRRWIASAYTPAQGQMDEITNSLLTLDRGTLYCSTNLGAVAALDTADGNIRWITLYQRASGGDYSERAAHFSRDLTPPVYDRGRLIIAPSDTSKIIALDATTGLLLWETDHPDDAIHVLGVGGGNVIVSGEKLWWINAITGKLAADPWPQGADPKGFGRGVLAGDRVYWPTRTAIYVFSQQTAAQLRQPLELPTSRGASGGNLIVADDRLLIVTSDEIIAFNLAPHDAPDASRQATR